MVLTWLCRLAEAGIGCRAGMSSGDARPNKVAKSGLWTSCSAYIAHQTALFNPETSILIQTRHPYTGKLNRQTSGDSKNTRFYIVEMFLAPEVLQTGRQQLHCNAGTHNCASVVSPTVKKL